MRTKGFPKRQSNQSAHIRHFLAKVTFGGELGDQGRAQGWGGDETIKVEENEGRYIHDIYENPVRLEDKANSSL